MTDLFVAASTKTDLERAKDALRAMTADHKGRLLGCISYLARTMSVPFSVAWDLTDRLVAQGFLSETDGHGRRVLMEAA